MYSDIHSTNLRHLNIFGYRSTEYALSIYSGIHSLGKTIFATPWLEIIGQDSKSQMKEMNGQDLNSQEKEMNGHDLKSRKM